GPGYTGDATESTMSQQPTIFDKILAGEIPCHRVHEDQHTLAFLDIAPLAPGHTLVIPKQARAYLHELDDEYAAAIGRVLPRVARAVLAASGAEAYNILQNNGRGAHQAVFHVHFHIIPKIDGKGLGIGWVPGRLDTDEAQRLLAAMQASLAPRGQP
ncbi:MAG TPA: HIT family protein, partial [Enhygromyxa sp.]|nr:HIT family protein [Enhygromyxa sp.]